MSQIDPVNRGSPEPALESAPRWYRSETERHGDATAPSLVIKSGGKGEGNRLDQVNRLEGFRTWDLIGISIICDVMDDFSIPERAG